MDDSNWQEGQGNPMMSQNSGDDLESQSLASLNQVKQETSDYEDNLSVQPAEEIIDSDVTLPQHGVIGVDDILIPLPDNRPSGDNGNGSTTGKRKKASKKGKRLDIDKKAAKKWEQKQVHVKTLDGSFPVEMWASGKSFVEVL